MKIPEPEPALDGEVQPLDQPPTEEVEDVTRDLHDVQEVVGVLEGQEPPVAPEVGSRARVSLQVE